MCLLNEKRASAAGRESAENLQVGPQACPGRVSGPSSAQSSCFVPRSHPTFSPSAHPLSSKLPAQLESDLFSPPPRWAPWSR